MKKDRDWVRMRGIIGLCVFIIGLAFTKIVTIYNLFQNHRLLIGLILFMVLATSLTLYIRYYMERNKR